MKKIFFLTFLLLSAVMTFAQTKKVAVTEVADKENKLSYSLKLMLRSNLVKAVSKTNGYEAYERADIDAIISEHEFQRTGMVNESEIRKLGDMTGVSYILFSEAVMTPDNMLFVSVKLLNLESAKVEIQDNIVLGTTSTEMQEGCEALARTLFGKATNFKVTTTTSASLKSTMNKKEYAFYLQYNCPSAYAQYKSGRKLVAGGWATAVIGIVFIGAGAALMKTFPAVYEYHYRLPGGNVGIGLLAVGVISTAASVPLLTLGYININKSAKTYDANCASSQPKQLSFNLTAGQNGIGVAMNF